MSDLKCIECRFYQYAPGIEIWCDHPRRKQQRGVHQSLWDDMFPLDRGLCPLSEPKPLPRSRVATLLDRIKGRATQVRSMLGGITRNL